MWKRTSTLLLSAAILVAGYYGATKLRYWERSIWVFKSATPPQRFERRDRGFSGQHPPRNPPEQQAPIRERPRPADLPPEGQDEVNNSGRERNGRTGEQFERGDQGTSRTRQRSDRGSEEIRQDQERGDARAPSFRRGSSDEGRRGHRSPGRGRKISFGNVGWFLAVFASFAVLTIYLDRVIRPSRRKKIR